MTFLEFQIILEVQVEVITQLIVKIQKQINGMILMIVLLRKYLHILLFLKVHTSYSIEEEHE